MTENLETLTLHRDLLRSWLTELKQKIDASDNAFAEQLEYPVLLRKLDEVKAKIDAIKNQPTRKTSFWKKLFQM